MSYISWHWSVMQNLRKNWLLVWKMTWWIWQIFTRTHGSVKIGTLMGSFCSKQKIHKINDYRGVMYNDTGKWLKIWRGIDLLFQNWHREFDEILLEYLEVWKMCTLMGCLWPKYIIFEPKKTVELSFMTLERDAKFEEELTCQFKTDVRKLMNFDLSTQKSQKFSL